MPSRDLNAHRLEFAAAGSDALRSVPAARWGAAVLLGYQWLIVGALLAMFLIFSAAPWWLQLGFVWIGFILGGRLETILHWSVHSPPFRGRWSALWYRLSFCVVAEPAILYRAVHFHHHRHDNGPADETSTLDAGGRRHCHLASYLLVAPEYDSFLAAMTPAERLECRTSFALSLLLTLALATLDWRATMLLWVPATWFAPIVIGSIYNFTDHVPSLPGQGFRSATYTPLDSAYRRLLSFVDLHNIATHATHHRFPQIHWTRLPDIQREQEAEYRALQVPQSVGLNSAILFNPLAFAAMLYRVNRIRNDLLPADGKLPCA